MQIDISEVSFKITDNRWLEIHVGEQEVLSIDAIDGGVELCPRNSDGEIGNLVADEDGDFEFVANNEECDDNGEPVEMMILRTLERIEEKL